MTSYTSAVPQWDPLVELIDEGRTDDRAAERNRERWLRRAAEEGATLAGLLVDLAEREATVVVHTEAGGRHHGVLVTVGADYCVVRSDSGAEPLIRLDGLASVRSARGERPDAPAGDRRPVVDLLLIEVLGRAVDERPRLVLVTRGGERVAGELRSVGADVVTLVLDGDRDHLCCVAAAAISEAMVDH